MNRTQWMRPRTYSRKRNCLWSNASGATTESTVIWWRKAAREKKTNRKSFVCVGILIVQRKRNKIKIHSTISCRQQNEFTVTCFCRRISFCGDNALARAGAHTAISIAAENFFGFQNYSIFCWLPIPSFPPLHVAALILFFVSFSFVKLHFQLVLIVVDALAAMKHFNSVARFRLCRIVVYANGSRARFIHLWLSVSVWLLIFLFLCRKRDELRSLIPISVRAPANVRMPPMKETTHIESDAASCLCCQVVA